jgi:hypothetical protein
MTPSIKPYKRFNLETPAFYRIRVQGALDQTWSDALSGMIIAPSPARGDPPVTILVGYLTDQAALSGVLNSLYELRLPLLSVENLDEMTLLSIQTRRTSK